jgi:ubiquitin C-terminal hydrolase
MYSLVAVICHSGPTLETGQFYCYVKRSIQTEEEKKIEEKKIEEAE